MRIKLLGYMGRGLAGLLTALLALSSSLHVPAQSDSKGDAKKVQKQGLYVLDRLKFLLKDRYFDQTFGGLDIDATFKAGEAKMRSITGEGEMFAVASEVLTELQDSHTSIAPPPRREQPEYGFSSMILGDKCFVTNIYPGGRAEAAGLNVGDQILKFGAVEPTRGNFKKIIELIHWIAPVKNLQLTIATLAGKNTEIMIPVNLVSAKERRADFKRRKELDTARPYTCKSVSDDVVACKLRTFTVETYQLDAMLNTIKGAKKLILDLRGNGGGFPETAIWLMERLFNRKLIAVTSKTKTGTSTEKINGKSDAFSGEISVIIDSETASAAEVVARVIQIEKRGKIVGDISAGAVRTARLFVLPIPEKPGSDTGGTVMFALVRLTVADVAMSDGSRLEGVGVIPDEGLVPNGIALSRGLDPIFAHTANAMGVKISPEEAGKLGFVEDPIRDSIFANVPDLP